MSQIFISCKLALKSKELFYTENLPLLYFIFLLFSFFKNFKIQSSPKDWMSLIDSLVC